MSAGIISRIDVNLSSAALLEIKTPLFGGSNNSYIRAIGSFVSKATSYIGFGNEASSKFDLADYNGDGESCLGLNVHADHHMVLRNSKGKVVFKSPKGNSREVTLALPAGEYSYLIHV
jgi:hypothetical protein